MSWNLQRFAWLFGGILLVGVLGWLIRHRFHSKHETLRGDAMSDVTIRVGDYEVQKRFLVSHEPFLHEYLEIRALIHKMFRLALEKYNEELRPEETRSEPTDLEVPKVDETELRLG